MALRNYVQRRNHKERGQLASRKQLGLLEKKKDYKLRAEDHHAKTKALKRLEEKVQNKNVDEFSFAMIRGRIDRKSGQHITGASNEQKNFSHALISLLKTQDSGALREQLRKEKKRLDKLVDRLGPLVPQMRVVWLHHIIKDDFEGRTRGQVLQASGLLASSDSGNGHTWAPLDEDELETVDTRAQVGTLGKKTVWCDNVDDLRDTPSSKARGKARAHDSAEEGEEDEGDYDLDADALDGDDDLDLAPDPDLRRGEKYTSYLIQLLSGRQARVAVLSGALGKLDLVRNIMRTKGQHVNLQRPRDVKRHDETTDLVAQGKVTPFGIALPGYEDAQATADEDHQDSFGFSQRGFKGQPNKPAKKSYKWSKERKR